MFLDPAFRDESEHIGLYVPVLENNFGEFKAQGQGLADHLRIYAEGDEHLGEAAAALFLLLLGFLYKVRINEAGFKEGAGYFLAAIIHWLLLGCVWSRDKFLDLPLELLEGKGFN